jgi:uncharacterized protein (DUF1697 family)
VGAVRYIALLRGVNVGGRNLVAMKDLREAFEAAGHRAVRTYIQSGNVLFESDAPGRSLEAAVEAMLERQLGIPVVAMLRSHHQLRRVVEEAPLGFGGAPDRHHSDVIFLKAPLTSTQAMRAVQVRDGVDRAWPGTGVLYFERLSERLAQSRLSRIVGTPEYQRMTIRTWTTTTKLLNLLETP